MSSIELPLHHNVFANNYNSSFNIYSVILTTMIFFLILSWYNFFLSLWYYIFNYNPNSSLSEKKYKNLQRHNKKKELRDKYLQENEIILRNGVWANFGYALFWSLVTILIYLYVHGYL